MYKVNQEAVNVLGLKGEIMGATIVPNGDGTDKAILVIKEGVSKIIRLIDDIKDLAPYVEDLIEKGSPIWLEIELFMSSILNLFPVFLEKGEKRYRKGFFPAFGEEHDIAAYVDVSLINQENCLYLFSEKRMFNAKKQLSKALKEDDIL